MKDEITKNFSLHEFKVSDSYPEIAKNIVLTNEQEENIKLLVYTVLQPIRNFLNESIRVISGVRNEELNFKIKGSKTSDHMIGAASDITSNKILNNEKEIAYKIWDLNLPIRQIIYYPNRGFIHISINTNNKLFKHELLQALTNGTYKLES
jgi:uncharacterized protein YcbK (DUF882 family)